MSPEIPLSREEERLCIRYAPPRIHFGWRQVGFCVEEDLSYLTDGLSSALSLWLYLCNVLLHFLHLLSEHNLSTFLPLLRLRTIHISSTTSLIIVETLLKSTLQNLLTTRTRISHSIFHKSQLLLASEMDTSSAIMKKSSTSVIALLASVLLQPISLISTASAAAVPIQDSSSSSPVIHEVLPARALINVVDDAAAITKNATAGVEDKDLNGQVDDILNDVDVVNDEKDGLVSDDVLDNVVGDKDDDDDDYHEKKNIVVPRVAVPWPPPLHKPIPERRRAENLGSSDEDDVGDDDGVMPAGREKKRDTGCRWDLTAC